MADSDKLKRIAWVANGFVKSEIAICDGDFHEAYLQWITSGDALVGSMLNSDPLSYQGACCYFNDGTDYMEFELVEDPFGIPGQANAKGFSIKKNTNNGFLNYTDLVFTDPAVFDEYDISFVENGESLMISVHTGNTGHNPYSMKLSYEKKTLFPALSDIFSKVSESVGTNVVEYEEFVIGSHLYMSYPDINTRILNKTVEFWGSNADTIDDTVDYTKTISSVDGKTGKITLNSATGGAVTHSKIKDVDLSMVIDEFMFTELNVHGRDKFIWPFDQYRLGNAQKIANYVTAFLGTSGNYKRMDFENHQSPLQKDGLLASFIPAWGMVSFYTKMLKTLIVAEHDYSRCGLHSECFHEIDANSVNGDVYSIIPMIPISFNKRMTALKVITTNDGFETTAEFSNNDVLAATTKFDLNLQSDKIKWTFRTHTRYNTIGNYMSTYSFTTDLKLDRRKAGSVSVGSGHVALTGNPAYSMFPLDSGGVDIDNEVSLSSGVKNDVWPPVNRMIKDFTFAWKNGLIIGGRLYVSNVQMSEFQIGVRYGEIKQNDVDMFFSRMGSLGPTYHLFDHLQTRKPCGEIGKITGMAIVNMPQSLDSAIVKDRNSILVMAENGYKYFDLSQGDPALSQDTFYIGDCCISKKSIVSVNGLAFCAGLNGVYMFEGNNKVDITSLGASDIKKTWAELDRSVKESAIGCFNPKKKWYMLAISLNGENIIYIFDFLTKSIWTMKVPLWQGKLVHLEFLNGELYAFTDIITYEGLCVYYSDSLSQDFGENTTYEDIGWSAETNSYQLTDRDVAVESLQVDYDADNPVTFEIMINGIDRQTGLILAAGQDKRHDYRWKRDVNKRGRRVSFKFEGTGKAVIKNIGIEIVEPIQRKWIKAASS